jgi:hypothetical protein
MRSRHSPLALLLALALPAAALADPASRLRVDFDPVAADLEGGRWRLVSSDPILGKWRRSGDVIFGVADGLHRIAFEDGKASNPNAICSKPADMEVFIRPASAHQAVGLFACNAAAASGPATTVASLQINIEPAAAVAGGARWALDQDASDPDIVWHASGVTIPNVSEGDHLIVYKGVGSGPCTTTPPQEAVAVYVGGTTTRTARYSGAGC